MSSRFYERLLAAFSVLVILTVVISLALAIWGVLAWPVWWRVLATAVLVTVPGVLVIGILGSQAEKREKRK